MIFIDTGALLARYLPSDQYFSVATILWEKIRVERELCVTSNFVLDETFSLMARRASYSFAAEKARSIYSSGAFQILRPTESDELAALELFEKYADQKVSFTDCISFVLMRRTKIQQVFSFDKHFEQAGFKKLK